MNIKFETDDWTQFGQILGSVLFPVGLFIVCSCRLDLFTGKIGFMFEQSQDCLYFLSLIVMLIGNIGSAVGFGLLMRLAFNSLLNFNSTIEKISKNKYVLNDSNDYLRTIVQSMFCGSCVHLAVKSFRSVHSLLQQLVILVWFIAIFVYGGFQHCIANSFFFACSHSTTRDVYLNICLVTIGNAFGTLPVSLITRDFIITEREPTTSTDEPNEV